MNDDENRILLIDLNLIREYKKPIILFVAFLLLGVSMPFMCSKTPEGPVPLTDEEMNTLGETLRTASTSGERQDAAGKLGQTGDERAVPFLIQGLNDEDDYVQQASRSGLVQIGKPAVAPLMEELKSEFKDVQNLALTALMDITGQYFGTDYAAWSEWAVSGNTAEPTPDEKETVEQIKKLLSGHQDWVYEALQELKKKKSDAAYRAVIELLDNSRHDIPKWAITALGEMGGERAVEALIRKYRKTEPALMHTLERTFLRMGMQGIEALVILLGDRENRNVPLYAAQTLAKRLNEDFKGDFLNKRKEWSRISERGIEQLSELLNYELEGIRAFAAEILGRTGNELAVDPLVVCLGKKFPKQSSRSGAFIGKDFEFELIRALGNLGPRKASDTLNKMLRDEKKKKRSYNLPSYRQIVLSFAVSEIDQDRDALGFLIEALNRGLKKSGRDKGQSEWAAYLLVESTMDVGGQLIRSLSEKDDDARQLAAWVLGQRKEQAALKPLMDTLEDKDREVKVDAVTALGLLNNPEGLDRVVTVLEKDDDMFVRRAACYALGRSGNKDYIEPLINALNDKRQDVKSAAHYMLKELTGEKFRSQSYDTWKKWYLRTKGK